VRSFHLSTDIGSLESLGSVAFSAANPSVVAVTKNRPFFFQTDVD